MTHGTVSAIRKIVIKHLLDDGLVCVVRTSHPEIGDSISREQYEQMKHVNVLPPGWICAFSRRLASRDCGATLWFQ